MSTDALLIKKSFDDLPGEPALAGALSELRQEARDLHVEVSDKIRDLQQTLSEARVCGVMLQQTGLFGNPVLKALGFTMVETVDAVSPRVAETASDIDTVFEGFDIATGGAGNPDRIAAIAEHLMVDVSEAMEALADEMSVSRLSTPGRWDSPATSSYLARADSQTQDGMEPLAKSVAEAARVLEAYAESQVEYSSKLGRLWIDLFWLTVSLVAFISGLVEAIGTKFASGSSVSPAIVFEAIGWFTALLGLLGTAYSFSRVVDAVTELRAMTHEPSDTLQEKMAAARGAVDLAWPRFAREL